MRTLSCSKWDLVPWPGIEPGPPALGVQHLSHWTTREVLLQGYFVREKIRGLVENPQIWEFNPNEFCQLWCLLTYILFYSNPAFRAVTVVESWACPLVKLSGHLSHNVPFTCLGSSNLPKISWPSSICHSSTGPVIFWEGFLTN